MGSDVTNSEKIRVKPFSVKEIVIPTSFTELGQEEKNLLEMRLEARKAKDFQKSDELRDALKQRGIVVEDTRDGQTWRWA